jgi:excinuclease ABC subunit A
MLQSADWIIEVGPGAGANGGTIVAQGTPETIAASDAETARFLTASLSSAETTPAQTPSRQRQLLVDTLPGMVAEGAALYGDGGLTGGGRLVVTGARENNLKNLSIEIPHRELSVVTGISGSGKSTLAFDIIFAEGQRRFMESMSPYARQFVEQLPRPQLDRLSGIPPTVAIEQRVTRGSRKSTVATITEVAQYLRLLYARIGLQHNPNSGQPVIPQTESELGDVLKRMLAKPAARRAKKLFLLAPLVRGRKGHHQPLANWAADHGYERLRIDGRVILTDRFEKLDRYREHDIEAVVADLKSATTDPSTVRKKLSEALNLGRGSCLLLADEKNVLGWL